MTPERVELETLRRSTLPSTKPIPLGQAKWVKTEPNWYESLVCIDFEYDYRLESWFNTMNLDSLWFIPIHFYESLPKVIAANHFFWSNLYSEPFFFSHFICELHLELFWCSYIMCQLIFLKCHLFLLTNSFGNVS